MVEQVDNRQEKCNDPEVLAAFMAFYENLKGWICRHCGQQIQEERQVGRCVYADPCGHRLWQGKARGARPAELEQ